MLKKVKYQDREIEINIADDSEIESNEDLINLDNTLELYSDKIINDSVSDTAELEVIGDDDAR